MYRPVILATIGAVLLTAQPARGVQFEPLHEELTVAAVAMSDDMDADDHGADWLQHYMPELKRRVASGEVDAEDARARAADELRRRAAEFDPAEPLTLEKTLHLREYDSEREAFRLAPLFHERYFTAVEPYAKSLPTSYPVLFANADLADYLPMAPDEARAFKARREGGRGQPRRPLWARIAFRLMAFQNGHDFQAVLTRIELFESKDMAEPLHTLKESRDFDRLVQERLLSEGITWEVTENHSFNYRGIRLLALLPENHPDYSECRDVEERLAGHRQILCRLDVTGRDPARLEERLYVGGRLARVALHRGEDVADGERRQLYFDLRKVGRRNAAELEESVTWKNRGAVLRFDPEALDPDAEKTAYLVVEAEPYSDLVAASQPDTNSKHEPDQP